MPLQQLQSTQNIFHGFPAVSPALQPARKSPPTDRRYTKKISTRCVEECAGGGQDFGHVIGKRAVWKPYKAMWAIKLWILRCCNDITHRRVSGDAAIMLDDRWTYTLSQRRAHWQQGKFRKQGNVAPRREIKENTETRGDDAMS